MTSVLRFSIATLARLLALIVLGAWLLILIVLSPLLVMVSRWMDEVTDKKEQS